MELKHKTSQGIQTAFYLPPREVKAAAPSAPPWLWVMFHGKGATALDWVWVERRAPCPEAGFLLIDYPGYGLCEGKSSAGAILESSEMAFQELARHLNAKISDLEKNLGVTGCSIGTGAGLQFAVKHNVQRVILSCAFTSLSDAVRHRVGGIVTRLLREEYNNRKRLEELAARPHPPKVDLFHGTADRVTPLWMAEELARRCPAMITLHRCEGRKHEVFLDDKDLVEIFGIRPAAQE